VYLLLVDFMRSFGFVWFFAALSMFGCSSAQRVVKQPVLTSPAIEDYSLGVGDQISVQVWKSPELSIVLPIRPDGKISVPLIGDVVAAGVTTAELSTSLEKGFSSFVRNSQVTVIVLDPSSGVYLRRVRVTGAVVQPISRSHQQGMTVLDLVLESGGVTAFSNPNKTKLYRKVNGKVEVFPINLDDILTKGILDTNYTLAPSDIVTVPERSF
jgi:polysaccharide export outer membrane protein